MPELSRFFGIIVRMYMEVGGPHQLPYFHAYYQDDVGVFSLDPIELIAGSLPRRQRRLVEAWAELHQAELLADWEKLQSGNCRHRLSRLNEGNRPMTHAIHRVRSFEVKAPFVMRICFDDGTDQIVDFQPILGGELYRPLRDLNLFNQVRIDPEIHTLVWPNGADFDPATLHDWPQHVNELSARARQWELATMPGG